MFMQIITNTEVLRENQRILRRSMRDIERERMTLQRQEKSLTIEIKNMAKKGQMVQRDSKPTFPYHLLLREPRV